MNRGVKAKWYKIHVVGDSSIIITLLKDRKLPKNQNLLHWYRLTRKLADECQVASSSHCLIEDNKSADWPANLAMDTMSSHMVVASEVTSQHPVVQGVEERISGDVRRWIEDHQPT